MMTSKQKIDQALGLSSGQSINDFLDELTMKGDVEQLSASFDTVGNEIKSSFDEIDNTRAQPSLLQLSSLQLSMKEVEDLVALSKNMFKHVYEQIVTTSLLDSEAIAAASHLLESVHLNIAEFIGMYKQRQQFVDKLSQMRQAYEYDIMKMDHKHQLDMEKMRMKLDSGAVDAEEGLVNASFEDMIKSLAAVDDQAPAIANALTPEA